MKRNKNGTKRIETNLKLAMEWMKNGTNAKCFKIDTKL